MLWRCSKCNHTWSSSEGFICPKCKTHHIVENKNFVFSESRRLTLKHKKPM